LTVLVPGEDPIVYECFAAGMLDAWQPLNTPEAALVQELTDVQWRLRRASRHEATILTAETLDMKALNNLGIYTARLKRQFSATLKEFEQMHKVNKVARRKRMEDAEYIYKADKITGRPSTFDDYGFDFTKEEQEQWMFRKDELEKCKDIVTDYEFDYGDDDEDDDLGDLDHAA
jgi:hypothetical protein